MIWSLGLWWIWKVVNEHKKRTWHSFSQCNNCEQTFLFLLVEILTIEQRRRSKGKNCYNTDRFQPWIFLLWPFFSILPLLPWAVSVLYARPVWVLEKDSCVKGNSRLLFHWPDDDAQCFKMALNKLMSSRQEGCSKHSDSSTNNAADDHRMLKDPHFEV